MTEQKRICVKDVMKTMPGTIVRARVVRADEYDLWATPLGD